jgi:hypothetical protein
MRQIITGLSDWFYSRAHPEVILLLLIGVVGLVSLPIADEELVSQSLDSRLGYSPADAFEAVEAYGSAGRRQMAWIHVGDFVLIALYSAGFCLTISWLFQRSFRSVSPLWRLNTLPLLGGFFDVLENVCIIVLILAFPGRPTPVAWLATLSTTGKYLMGVPIIGLLILGTIGAAANGFELRSARR